jgi:hypothetical protein
MGDNGRSDYEVARSFVEAARQIIPHYYPPGYCVAATRISVELLRALQLPTRPLMVRVGVLNPALVAKGRMPASTDEGNRWADEDNAALVVCGDPRVNGDAPWSGHVVAIAGERWLIDLALPELSRPQKCIELAPLLARVGPAFLAGHETLELMQNGCRLIYDAFPMNWSYAGSRDWQDIALHGPALEAIWNCMGEGEDDA